MKSNRRSLVLGAAWATPVIAVSCAAPAYAASRTVCETNRYCKKPGTRRDRWDFYVYPGCTGGEISTCIINGKSTKTKWTAAGVKYFVLENQPHSYTFRVQLIDTTNIVAFDKVVDTRNSSCPA